MQLPFDFRGQKIETVFNQLNLQFLQPSIELRRILHQFRDLIDLQIRRNQGLALVFHFWTYTNDLQFIQCRNSGRCFGFFKRFHFRVNTVQYPIANTIFASEPQLITLLLRQPSSAGGNFIIINVQHLDFGILYLQQVWPNPIGKLRRQIEIQRDNVRLILFRMTDVVPVSRNILPNNHLFGLKIFVLHAFANNQIDQHITRVIL